MSLLTAAPPQRRRARRMPADERRPQILAAALNVFARRGYMAAATAEIAAEAGIGEPTIYRYFESKQELYLQALSHNAAHIATSWREIAVEHEGEPLLALMMIGRWYAEQLDEDPEPLLLHFRSFSESHDPRVAGVVREGYRELMSFVEGLFEQAQGMGKVRFDADVKTLTWSFMAMGALIDVTRLLGMGSELGQAELAKMSRLILSRS